MKAIGRLGFAWFLMLAGGVLLLDGGVAQSFSCRELAVSYAIGGFGLLVIGATLRRSAFRS